jgi:hypothetical protein
VTSTPWCGCRMEIRFRKLSSAILRVQMRVVGTRWKSAMLGQCLPGDAKQPAERKYIHQKRDQ